MDPPYGQGQAQQQQQQQTQQQQQGPRRYDGSALPAYDTTQGGHYGACAAIAAAGHAPPPETFAGQWSNVPQGLHGQYRDIANTYWQHQVNKLETEDHDYKLHQLPLARIKKVMKADPEVKMISAEAPILFAKACDIFITELTMRAWIHAEENKRRTLQRSDIASALAKSDMFDFLIDIVPREDATPHHKRRADFPTGTYGEPTMAAATAGPSAAQQQPPVTAQPHQHMRHPDYSQMGGHLPPEEYQQQTGMYPPPVPGPGGYAQQAAAQGMFDYAPYSLPLQGPVVDYTQRQRHAPQDFSAHSRQHPGHDQGIDDADAEGERDYEVG
ncbi:histone-fold-containing protein [Cryomyces antarcticus]